MFRSRLILLLGLLVSGCYVELNRPGRDGGDQTTDSGPSLRDAGFVDTGILDSGALPLPDDLPATHHFTVGVEATAYAAAEWIDGQLEPPRVASLVAFRTSDCSGASVGSTTSDESGRFRIDVAPVDATAIYVSVAGSTDCRFVSVRARHLRVGASTGGTQEVFIAGRGATRSLDLGTPVPAAPLATTSTGSIEVESPPRWIHFPPGASPPSPGGVVDAAAAVDPIRGRVVVYGGREGQSPSDALWEFDGVRWVRQRPTSSPGPRAGAAMTYLSRCRCVVLVGGEDASGPVPDVWGWDGADWRPLTAVPEPRIDPVLVRLPTGSLVLHGGRDLDGNPSSEAWTFDGQTWVQIADGPALASHAAAWVDGSVLVHGGDAPEGVVSAMHRYDPQADAWSTTSTASALVAADHSLTVLGGEVRAFGGRTGPGNVPSEGPSLHRLIDAEWIPLDFPGPAPRLEHVAVDFGDRQELVIVGGQGSFAPLPDVWVLNEDSWLEVTPSNNPPRPQSNGSVGYDPTRHETVLLTGADSVGATGQPGSHVWNGVSWRQGPALGSVTYRYGGEIAYDELAGELWLAGGYGANLEWHQQVYRRTTSGWEEAWMLPPADDGCSTNITRGRLDLIFASAGARGLMVGYGYGWCGAQGDLFEGTPPLTAIAPSGDTPEARRAQAAVDVGDGLLVMHSGRHGPAGMQVVDARTWLFDLDEQRWSFITDSDGPGRRVQNQMVYDSHRGRVVLLGGADENQEAQGDVWEWEGADWVRVQEAPGASVPPARFAAASAYDLRRRRIVYFGGEDTARVRFGDGVWELDNDPGRRPVIVAPVTAPDDAFTPRTAACVVSARGVFLPGTVGATPNPRGPGTTVVGGRLELWSERALRWITDDRIAAPFEVEIRRPASEILVGGAETFVRLTTTSANGTGRANARVRADYVEMTVLYAVDRVGAPAPCPN